PGAKAVRPRDGPGRPVPYLTRTWLSKGHMARGLLSPDRVRPTRQRDVSPPHLRIMLVDEQPDRFALLDEALRAQGHEIVAHVTSGGDIVEAFGRSEPDVVIVDLDSPGRDTLESMRTIS